MEKVRQIIPHGGYTDEPWQVELEDGGMLLPYQVEEIYVMVRNRTSTSTGESWTCPINSPGCTSNCGGYGCGN